MLAKLFARMSGAARRPKINALWTNRDPAYAQHQIGDWTYGTPSVWSWGEEARLTIGRYCSIADGVVILLGGEHRTDWVTTYPFSALLGEARQFAGHPKTRGDVVIGSDVWIGRGATILSGVKIAHGAVIGACSVVTRDVGPYEIAAGNPARMIRCRFPSEIVDSLLKIAWWDWPRERIIEALPQLLSDDVAGFAHAYAAASGPEGGGRPIGWGARPPEQQ